MKSSPVPKPMDQASTGNEAISDERANGNEELFDFGKIVDRLRKGLNQIVALTLLGLVIAAIGCWITSSTRPVPTSLQVIYTFPGFDKGEYPDHSKFQGNDLIAPQIVSEALKREQPEAPRDFQSSIRGALLVEGIIPLAIAKNQERIRASGQTPPFFIPNEYKLTLSLPRTFPLSTPEREHLLNEIVDIYRDNFQKTYADAGLLLDFGNAFESLKNADFPEYEMILDSDIENANHFLNDQIGRSRTYRSPTTLLTFSDLRTQLTLFSQIRLNEVLGLIYANGLSRDRSLALVRMNYRIKMLEDEVSADAGEEKVYTDLLAKAGERAQSYVLGIKTQAGQPVSEAPIIDKGLIDSLVANDIFNSLVRQSIDMGIRTKRAEATLAEATRQRDSFARTDANDQSVIPAQIQKSLTELNIAYTDLISKIRTTYSDFERQQYADAIQITSGAVTETLTQSLLLASGFGIMLGGFIGIALSLFGVYIDRHIDSKRST